MLFFYLKKVNKYGYYMKTKIAKNSNTTYQRQKRQ